MKTIDLNADVGEGLNNEGVLMPCLSSCSIACGGHAGDTKTMEAVAKLAKQHQVKVGAHPSFPDKANFGREVMEMTPKALFDSLKQQVDGLLSVLDRLYIELNHIKPHGALYNLAAKDEITAQVIIDVVKAVNKNRNVTIKLYAPYKSVVADLAITEKVPVVYEAFADRNYNEDLSLVSRQNQEALITKKEAVFEHVFKMISHQKVKAKNGVEVPIKASTFCVHGDSKNAPKILQFLHSELLKKGINIK